MYKNLKPVPRISEKSDDNDSNTVDQRDEGNIGEIKRGEDTGRGGHSELSEEYQEKVRQFLQLIENR